MAQGIGKSKQQLGEHSFRFVQMQNASHVSG